MDVNVVIRSTTLQFNRKKNGSVWLDCKREQNFVDYSYTTPDKLCIMFMDSMS